MKTHIEKEHEKPCNIFHIKMDRNDPSLVDFKSYRSDKIQRIFDSKRNVDRECIVYKYVERVLDKLNSAFNLIQVYLHWNK